MIGDRVTLAHALVAVGVVLLVVPALAPVQQYRVHDTRGGTTADRAELEESGIEVVAYENLSDRGQELYRETLENGGRYTVPIGQGAPDFDYGAEDRDDGRGPTGPSVRRSGTIAIERPPDADLPPADEPVEAVARAREREAAERERARERDGDRRTSTGNGTATPTTPDYDEMRETITRYDMMQTTTDSPPLSDTANLLRLFPALVGVLCLGVGGYRSSLP
ncbi:hypothetical protein [Halorientalis marina]|jgi:hypothetical protein|uniref:hypothetical protein n=1 Tax=Halorientalis marina TaxID=2931976 RepID=UPI001FF3EF79|nr:hypothetical protein [Halorientalis marina]